MNSLAHPYLQTVAQIIRREMQNFRKEFWGKFIDICSLLVTTVIMFSYFLPEYGLKEDYGPFILVGSIASFGFFECVGRVGTFLADLEGDRTILYTVSLPLPAWLVFSSLAFSWALSSSIIGLFLFPVGKLLLWSQFSLSEISYLTLIPMFFVSNLFFGFFSLWLCAILKHMGDIGHIWVRIINPLYMFGGYFYSWKTMMHLSQSAGYLSLLNPLTYVMEGMRATVLGQEEYLSVGLCLGALIAITVACAWHAVRRLKRRLDVV